MAGITLTLRGAKETIQKLERLEHGLSSFKPELKEIGEHLKEYYIKVPFETEGTVYGQRWPRLSERYAKWKRRKYIGKPFLERTGTMRKAFRYDADDRRLIVDNPIEYFKYHQSGGSRKTNLPRRQMIGLNQDLTDKILDIFRTAIRNKLKKIFV